MSESEAVTMPCGCRREMVKRQVPSFDPETGAPKMQDGAFVMEEGEEIQEVYCDEHTIKMIERQEQVQKALESGATAEEAMKILAGASPFPLLGDGSDEDHD